MSQSKKRRLSKRKKRIAARETAKNYNSKRSVCRAQPKDSYFMRFIVVLSAIGIVGYGLQMFFTNPQNSSVVSGIAILIVLVGLVFMCFGLFGEFDAIMELGDNHGGHIGGAAIISVIYMYRSMVDKFRNRS